MEQSGDWAQALTDGDGTLGAMRRVLRLLVWVGVIALLVVALDYLARQWSLEPPSRIIRFPRVLGD